MIKRKKILFITYENPYERNNGDRIYTCNFLDALTDLNFAVQVLAYTNNIKRNTKKNNDKLVDETGKDIEFTLIPFVSLIITIRYY